MLWYHDIARFSFSWVHKPTKRFSTSFIYWLMILEDIIDNISALNVQKKITVDLIRHPGFTKRIQKNEKKAVYSQTQ